MRHSECMRYTTRDRQAGVALFMALIVLLVLTVLGVFGMNIARLQNLMAGNNQFQATALNNAESLLTVGEADLESTVGTAKDWNASGDYYYLRTDGSTEIINPAAANWTFNYETVPADDPTSPFRYVLEYTGPYTDQKCAATYGASHADVCRRYIFLITAQNDASRGAKRTVQSVYVSPTPP
jgi:Tfp pilus assembly protein PilX